MTLVTSHKKISSNRRNAQKSSGPKSAAGKSRTARNALRHGLSIPVSAIAALRSDLETLALSIAQTAGKPTATELSEQAAGAQLELFRIRKVRATLLSGKISHEELNKQLARLERYERRAFSRRKRALREL
jgi:hypothetical protein